MLPQTLDAEDCEQEAALAELENKDPTKAVKRLINKERRRPINNYEMAWVSSSRKLISTRQLESKLTSNQKKKLIRNISIYIAHKAGMSQRELGRLYDLPHSRISMIIKEMIEQTL